jgi:tellurite resistance protein TehA-like permease
MSTSFLPRPAAGPAPAAASAQIVRGFHPGWFGAVMGTAIVGVAAYQNPGGEESLAHAAHVMGVASVLAAWAAAVLIAAPYLTRLVRHRDAARADLRHPVVGALYGEDARPGLAGQLAPRSCYR